LLQKIAAMFNLENEILLKYMDDEEMVTLTSDEDCLTALNKAKKRQPPILRVVVEDSVTQQEELISSAPGSMELNCSDATCCICASALTTVHYKCLNCLNFELCEQCEEARAHDIHHLLVKLRTPISTFPIKQQLLFHDHVEDEAQRKSAKLQKQQLIEEDKRAKLMAREYKKLQKEAEKLRKVQEREEKKRLKLVEKEEKKQANRNRKLAAKVQVETASPHDSLFWMDVPATTPLNDSLFTQPSAEPEPVPAPTSETAEPTLSPADDILELLSDFQEVNASLQAPVESVASQEVELETVTKESPVQEEKEEVPQEEMPPQPVEDKNAHPFKQNLERLREMGFTNESKNVKLLVENRGDLEATVEQLLHARSWLPEIFPLSMRF